MVTSFNGYIYVDSCGVKMLLMVMKPVVMEKRNERSAVVIIFFYCSVSSGMIYAAIPLVVSQGPANCLMGWRGGGVESDTFCAIFLNIIITWPELNKITDTAL